MWQCRFAIASIGCRKLGSANARAAAKSARRLARRHSPAPAIVSYRDPTAPQARPGLLEAACNSRETGHLGRANSAR